MKNRFIRILSPITLAVVFLLDCATISFSIIAVRKLIDNVDIINIAFGSIMIIVIVVALLVTKSTLTAGVRFLPDRLEFTAIDEDNIYFYCDIERVETQKDDKVSLTKNFNDRHSFVIIHLTEERLATVDIGLTTKRTLLKIEKEIKNRL